MLKIEHLSKNCQTVSERLNLERGQTQKVQKTQTEKKDSKTRDHATLKTQSYCLKELIQFPTLKLNMKENIAKSDQGSIPVDQSHEQGYRTDVHSQRINNRTFHLRTLL